MDYELFIGYDPRERLAWNVCARSVLAHAKTPPAITPVSITHLGAHYTRPTERRDGKLWDVISGAFCSTEFSIARFWSARLARTQWAVFMDGDFLLRADVAELARHFDPKKAVMVVQHPQRATGPSKMDGQAQSAYRRKWWSSLIAFNRGHAGIDWRAAALNTAPALDLHQFTWLADAEIGALPPEWNHLVGVDAPRADAKAVHFTLGTPDMPGWEKQEHADEWRHYAMNLKAAA